MICPVCDKVHGMDRDCKGNEVQIFNRVDMGEGKIIADLNAEIAELKKKVERAIEKLTQPQFLPTGKIQQALKELEG
jgi:uncharacterized Zn finger protein (UPF0148 family)